MFSGRFCKVVGLREKKWVWWEKGWQTDELLLYVHWHSKNTGRTCTCSWEIFMLQKFDRILRKQTVGMTLHLVTLKIKRLETFRQKNFASGGAVPRSCAFTHLREPSRISGARYQRVATYSVSAGLGWSSLSWHRERARPKSHSFTQHCTSSRTLEGWIEHRRIN